MLFLNAWLLLGLAGIAVPILIHLLNRRAARHVDWGAMRFLLDSLVSRKRRILLEEILLLGTRCLLVGLVALAVARPFVPAGSSVPWMFVLPALLLAVVLFGISFAVWRYPVWRRSLCLGGIALLLLAGSSVLIEKWLNLRRFRGGGQRDVVLVIDGSASMTVPVDGKTNFERAVEEAQRCVRRGGRRTTFGVVLGGAVPLVKVPAPINDRKELLDVLAALTPPGDVMQALDALSAAAVVLAQGYNPAKQIILFTDGQAIGWDTDKPARWEFLSGMFGKLPTRPQVVMRRFAPPPAFRNAAVTRLALSRPIVGTDREAGVHVEVSCTGTEAVTPRAVVLRVDGVETEERIVGQLAPGGSETVRFRHRFEETGPHVVSAEILVTDDLAADNRLNRALRVVPELDVLIVDGNPARRFIDRAAAFTALALAPGETTVTGTDAPPDAPSFLVRPELRDAPDLARDVAFEAYNVVILADVPRLPADVASALVRFVRAGGGLLITPGARALPDFYNTWRAEGGETVLPVPLEQRVVRAVDEADIRFDVSTFTHPALRTVARARRSDIGTARLDAFWRLAEPGPGSAAGVGGRLGNGYPLLVEHRLGRGSVILLGAPLDAQAGNLTTRHMFVPFVHELVYSLARSTATELNLEPAAALTLRLVDNVPGSIGRAPEGLQGEYFKDKDFQNRAATRTDRAVTFNWKNGSPMRGVPADYFSVRWSGSLVPRREGTYQLRASAHGSVSVRLDGREVIARGGKAEAVLEAGRRYDLRVEYRASKGNAGVQLMWEGPDTPRQVIPADCLSVLPGAHAFESGGTQALAASEDGRTVQASLVGMGGGLVARMRGDLMPGLYRLAVPERLQEGVRSLLDKNGEVPFVVRRDPRESTLTLLDEPGRRVVAANVDLLEARELDQVLQAMAGKAFGEELWRNLALLALVLVLAEIVLTRWIAAQRKTGQETPIDFEEHGKPSVTFREQLRKMRKRGLVSEG